MLKRAGSTPLTPPSPQKRAPELSATPGVDVDNTRERVKGFAKGRRERVIPVEMILRCPRCHRHQKIVFAFSTFPEWVRCIWCGELQPGDGYHMEAYGTDLYSPKTPWEIEAEKERK